MKKNKLFVSLLAAGMLAISPAMADDVVKITTNKQAGETVTLQVNQLGSGSTVDWGNGPVEITATDEDQLTLTGELAGSTITISSTSKLRTLICDGIGATAIDLAGAPNLMSLYCQNNAIASLDLSACSVLTDLNCENNVLSKLTISASKNANLQNLNIAGNKLTSSFSFSGSDLQHINVSKNAITGLSLSSNSKLDVVKCSENALTSLSVNAPSLTAIMCGDNKLTSLSIGGEVSGLRQVFAENNKIGSLNVSKALGLKYIAVENNELTSVTLPENSTLYAMTCQDNKLTYKSLPDYAMTNIKYLPQDASAQTIDIKGKLNNKRIDGTRYYYLIKGTKSELRATALPYVLDMRDYTDGVSVNFVNESGDNVADDDIITINNSKYAGYFVFANAQKEIINGEIVPTYYPELKISTSPSFYVVDSEEDLVNRVTAGINDIIVGKNALVVNGAQGVLTLASEDSTPVKVYTSAGQLVWQGNVQGTTTISLSTGVYIVNGKKVVL